MRALVFAAFVACAAVGCAASSPEDLASSEVSEVNASAPITLANWLTHPKILAVRDEVDAIDAAEDFTSDSKELCTETGHGEVERTKLTDANGVIRELVLAYGSEDSASIESYYYDARGQLRFVFVTRNDVHGSSSEMRTYLDAKGNRIWDVYRHAFSEQLDADVTKAPYEIVAAEDLQPLEPSVFTPGPRYDEPARCD